MEKLEEKLPEDLKDTGVFEAVKELCGVCSGTLNYSSKDKVYKCNKCEKQYSPEEVLG